MGTKFEQDPNLERELAQAAEIRPYLAELAAAAAETARRLVPVDSGNLRDSIEPEVTLEAGGYVGRVIATDFKASWIEFGTTRRAARPFIRPAIETEVGPLRDHGSA